MDGRNILFYHIFTFYFLTFKKLNSLQSTHMVAYIKSHMVGAWRGLCYTAAQRSAPFHLREPQPQHTAFHVAAEGNERERVCEGAGLWARLF